MSLVLKSVEDPRDALQKARRMELFRFAQKNGVKEIIHQMPADLMRKILRSKGLTNIPIPHRVLGQPEPRGHQAIPSANGKREVEAENVVEVDADDHLERQFLAQQASPPEPAPVKKLQAPLPAKQEAWKEKPVARMTINDLRWACKAKGIKLDRRDNMTSLGEKLKAAGLT